MSNFDEQLRNKKMRDRMHLRRMAAQGLTSPVSARSLQANLKTALKNNLMPGNVGDINRVIWPFWFTFGMVEVAPNATMQSNLTVTQEAAFVLMSYTKVVFNKTAGPVYTYRDPNNFSVGSGGATGLYFTLTDSSSTRTFHSNPQPVDTVGPPDEATVLPTPILFLPNSNIEISWSNQHASRTYVPFLTFFGYRIRMQDAQAILSTVNG